MTGEMTSHEALTAPEWDLHRSLALALGGSIHPFDIYQGPYIAPKDGGRLWIIEHGPSVKLFYERWAGDPDALTSRAVWGRADEIMPELESVARLLIARYQRNTRGAS